MSKILSVILIIVLGIVFYGVSLRGSLGNFTTVSELEKLGKAGSPFESSHERASYAEMIQMRATNKVDLPPDLRDFSAPDVGFKDDKYYSYFPPGISLFIRPFFELGYPFRASLLTTYASMALLSTLTMIFIYLICKNVFNLPSCIGIIAAIVYGFASTSWSYAITIFQHTPAAFFAAVMFYGVSRYRARVKTSALWASVVWFTYGISIMFDYPNGILLAPFIVYYFLSSLEIMRQPQTVNFKVNTTHMAVAIWFFIAVAFHLMFNLLYMPSWLTIRQVYDRYDPGLSRKLLDQESRQKLKTVTSEEVAPAVKQRYDMPFVEEVFISGANTLLVAPDKGIFFFSPVLLFAFGGLYHALKRKRSLEHAILLSFVLLNLLLYASFGDPYGGWAFGPRYLIPSMVVLSIYAAYALYHMKNVVIKPIFYVLFLFSMCVAAAGALTTNNVPPKIEADYLHQAHYNYALNFHLLETHKTGSFIYNTFLKEYMNVGGFYVLIVLSLGLIMYCFLFVSPLFNKHKK